MSLEKMHRDVKYYMTLKTIFSVMPGMPLKYSMTYECARVVDYLNMHIMLRELLI